NRGLQVRFLPGLLRVEASAYGAHRVAIDNTRGGHDVSGPTLGGKLEASERPTTLRGFSLSGGGQHRSLDHDCARHQLPMDAVAVTAGQPRDGEHPDYRTAYTHWNPPQLAGVRELDFSQLTNRNPPGASNFGSPGPGRICSCSSSTLFLEQFQQASAKSPSRR